MATGNKNHKQNIKVPTKDIRKALIDFFKTELQGSTDPFKLEQLKKAKTEQTLISLGLLKLKKEEQEQDINIYNARLTQRLKPFIKEGLLRKVDEQEQDGWYAFTDYAIKLLGDKVVEKNDSSNEVIDEEESQIKEAKKTVTKSDFSSALNTILYGPPGTGKTYITKQKAVQIVSGKILTGEELKLRYKQLKDSGIITFTTFHQSMGYEEFVEGLKAKADGGQVSYVVQAGILKQIVDKINQNEDSSSEKQQWETIYSIIRAGGDVWKVKPYAGYEDFKEKCFEDGSVGTSYFPDIDFTGGVTENLFDEIYAAAKGTPQSMNGNYALARIFAHKRINGEVILLTPDNKHISAIGIIQGNYYYDKSNFPEAPHRRKVDWLLKDIDLPFTLFHSKGKTGHFNGVDAASVDTDKIRDYKDSLQEDHTTLNHVLIIDEINRGNVSAIFGELITLLEDSKREGQPDALSVKLPYSGEDFILPSNLYIIGTMNTADRSVEALDTALRRRFVFEEMLPNPDLLSDNVAGIDVRKLLTTINDRLTALKDKNHTIGHAYFMNCKTAVDVLHVLCFKVLPLLEEYFYGQQELIEVVLSSEFFVEKEFQFTGSRKAIVDNLNLGENTKKKTLRSGPSIYKEYKDPAYKDKNNIGLKELLETIYK